MIIGYINVKEILLQWVLGIIFLTLFWFFFRGKKSRMIFKKFILNILHHLKHKFTKKMFKFQNKTTKEPFLITI